MTETLSINLDDSEALRRLAGGDDNTLVSPKDQQKYSTFLSRNSKLLAELKAFHSSLFKFVTYKRMLLEEYLQLSESLAVCAARTGQGERLAELLVSFDADAGRLLRGADEWSKCDRALETKVVEPLKKIHKAANDMQTATAIFADYAASGKRHSKEPNGGRHYAQCKRYHDQYMRRAEQNLENVIYATGMYFIAIFGDVAELWVLAHEAGAQEGLSASLPSSHSEERVGAGAAPADSDAPQALATHVRRESSVISQLSGIAGTSTAQVDTIAAAMKALEKIQTVAQLLADAVEETLFALRQVAEQTAALTTFLFSPPEKNFRSTVEYATGLYHSWAGVNSSVKRSVYGAKYRELVEAPLRTAQKRSGKLNLFRSTVSSILDEAIVSPIRRTRSLEGGHLRTTSGESSAGGVQHHKVLLALESSWVSMVDVSGQFFTELQDCLGKAMEHP